MDNLPDGLRLRRARRDDADALARFVEEVFRETGEPSEPLGLWTCDLMTEPHPTFGDGGFTLIEDTRRGQIVSCLCLIPQTWAYGSVPFGVGRVELVATHPDFRRRGLVRAQMETVHAWSAEQGHLAQVITGIPWYYRQFGYEMALPLAGGRAGYAPQVPALPPSHTEPYCFRPATEADLPFLRDRYAAAHARYGVVCLRDEAAWRLELRGRSEGSQPHVNIRIIETPTGERVGFLTHAATTYSGMLAATQYELSEGVSWLAVTPSVIRYLWATGQACAQREGTSLVSFGFWLGAEHPVYQAAPSSLPRVTPPYAFYVRVPDLVGFVRRIAPVLEARLARSIAVGQSADLRLNLYRQGLRLSLERGNLVSVESWAPSAGWMGNAAFPDLTFLLLLFGYRSLDDIKAAYPDAWLDNDETRVLLTTLFPKQPSNVWALG